MKKAILVFLFFISFYKVWAQNEKTNRDSSILNLPVDGIKFYEQKIPSSPYFVKENVLQIYPGEKLWIEVEVKGKEIGIMKVVKENLHPEKTLEIDFKQMVKDQKSESMLLKIANPFNQNLEYKAMMYIVGHNKWIPANVLPIKAHQFIYETWSDVIITLVLADWKFK